MERAPVLFVVNDFPPLLGGEATLYRGLVDNLPPDDLLLLAPRVPGDATVDAAIRCPVFRMRLPPHRGTLRRIARSLVAGVHIARVLLGRRIGFILCGQLLSLGIPTRALARISGIPYAVFVHGADLLDYDRGPWGALSRWVLAGASTVVVNSRFTAGLVASRAPSVRARIFLLPIGIDPPLQVATESVDRLRRRYALDGGPVLLSLARLVPIKGHDTVIRALPTMIARVPDLTYLIVGDGPERQRLEDLARSQSVEDRVRFAGAIPQHEVPAHYRLATLYVQLSRPPDRRGGVEGYGLSFLEAASYGVPAVAGRSGGVPEAVDDRRTGILVEPGDQEAFARAVVQLLGDRAELARLGANAARKARLRTWKFAAQALTERIEPARPGAVSPRPAGTAAGSVSGGFEQGGHRP